MTSLPDINSKKMKYKVIIVDTNQEDGEQLEKALNDGWKIAHPPTSTGYVIVWVLAK